MLFSIIIPVYNTGEKINECLKSIFDQSFSDYEILLCNDCSTDSSVAICEGAVNNGNGKIRLFRNEKNIGPMLTRRKLFKEARGEWILCMDADDVIKKNALYELALVIKKHSPDMIIYDAECKLLDGNTEKIEPSLEPNRIYANEDKKLIYSAIYDNNSLNSLCMKTFKRECIDLSEDYSVFPRIKTGEDLFQSYPIFDNAKKVYYLHKSLYVYRKNEGGITTKRQYDLYEMRKLLWERDDFYREKWQLDDAVIKKANLRRIKEIVAYLREEALVHDKAWLKEKMLEISADGFLEEAKKNCEKSFKYKLYSCFILKGRVKRFLTLSKIEGVLGNPIKSDRRNGKTI